MPGLGDPRIDLGTGQLSALTGLGALRHLDLNVVGVGEVVAGDAEPAGRDLLDGRPALWVVRRVGVPPAPAGVALAAEAVHRDRERFGRLGSDRSIGHGAGGEPRHYLGDGLDLV